jgi:hypothetical protein
VKLCEVENDKWHSLQLLVVQSEGYPPCDSAFGVCGAWSVDHVLDQRLTRPEEESEEKGDVAEHKATFLDAVKGLVAARKYMCRTKLKINYTD